MIKNNWFKIAILLFLLVISVFAFQYIKERDLANLIENCSNKGMIYLKQKQDEAGKDMVLSGRWKYSNKDKRCYFFEDYIYHDAPVLSSKHIINLDTNENLYYYMIGRDGKYFSGQPVEYVDALEKAILEDR